METMEETFFSLTGTLKQPVMLHHTLQICHSSHKMDDLSDGKVECLQFMFSFYVTYISPNKAAVELQTCYCNRICGYDLVSSHINTLNFSYLRNYLLAKMRKLHFIEENTDQSQGHVPHPVALL